MTTPADRDPQLESLYDGLRAQLATLNDHYHPVYPASPERLAEIEARVAEARAAIQARKRELAAIG